MNYKELSIRTLVGVLGIPIIFGSIYLGHLFFLSFILIIQMLALAELYSLTESKGFKPLKYLGISSLIFITISFYFLSMTLVMGVLMCCVLVCLLGTLFREVEGAIGNIAITVFGFLYLSLLSFFILIRNMTEGHEAVSGPSGKLIMLVFITIWVCDTCAYLFGSIFGKHTLFKRVSPKKTWEGSIAGFAAAMITVYLLSGTMIPGASDIDKIVIGIIVGLFGQASDLVESLFKRDAQIKDSSNLLPGHGGILDRFDSPILIAPMLYIYIILFGYPG